MQRFLLPLLVLAAGPASAQPHISQRPGFLRRDHPAIVQKVLEEQAERWSESAAKPAAVAQRIVAEVVYQQGGVASDSFRYFYASPQRGAAHNPKNPASYYAFEYSPFGDYAVTVGYGGGRQQYIQMDSTTRYDITGGGDPPVMLLRNFYNAANKLTMMEHLDDGPPIIDRRYNVTYNAASDPATCTYYDRYPTSTLTLNATQTTLFNAQHLPVADSIFTHVFGNQPDSKSLYTYNASGAVAQYVGQRWLGGAWQNSQRVTLTYNAAGLLQKMVQDDYIGAAWRPEYKDSFVYAGTNPSFTAEYGYQWETASNSWTQHARYLAHLNAAGNWDTVRTQYYDDATMTWGYLSRDVVTYNSYDNWETFANAYDDDQNGVIDPSTEEYGYTRYYCELWNNSLAMPAILAAQKADFNVYPNPTDARVWITWSGDASPARYILTDLSGRVLSSGPVMTNASRMELSLQAVPPGVYFFAAFDNTGAILHREKVVRR